MAHRLTRTLAPLLLLAGCAASGCAPPAYHDGGRLPVTVDGRTFEAELKLTPESRYLGMGGRAEMPQDFAMLFAYPEPQHLHYVMRDCAFPIDILFLDGQGRVVAKHRMVPDPAGMAEDDLRRYDSEASAQFALEIKGGWLDKLDITVGQTRLNLPAEALGAAAK